VTHGRPPAEHGGIEQTSLAPGGLAAIPYNGREQADRLAQATARLLPGATVAWTEAYPGRAYPSHIGIDAAAFHGVDAGERHLFAKVYHAEAAPFFDLASSIAAARLGACLGLSPKPIGEDAANGVVLFEYLRPPWRVATCADLRAPYTCAAIIERRRIWANAAFPEGALVDIFVQTRHMAAMAIEVIPKALLTNFSFPALRDFIDEAAGAFTAAGSDVAPVLGDNVVSNIMLDDAGGVQLVDFDFAGRGDPLRDIAGFCLEACGYDDDGVASVVEMHLGKAASDVLARVQILMIVEDFFWGAWAARLYATSPRKDACEFFAYAGSRLLRAGHALASLDAPALMRSI
jgi:hypothetical protein